MPPPRHAGRRGRRPVGVLLSDYALLLIEAPSTSPPAKCQPDVRLGHFTARWLFDVTTIQVTDARASCSEGFDYSRFYGAYIYFRASVAAVAALPAQPRRCGACHAIGAVAEASMRLRESYHALSRRLDGW